MLKMRNRGRRSGGLERKDGGGKGRLGDWGEQNREAEEKQNWEEKKEC